MAKGLIRLIGAMMSAMAAGDATAKEMAGGMNMHELGRHQATLLVNGYAGPIPRRNASQRQRRKAWRQNPNSRPKANRK